MLGSLGHEHDCKALRRVISRLLRRVRPFGRGAAPVDASQARLLVAIAHHHAPARLPLLLEVARALGDFAVERLDIVIITNAQDPLTLSRLRAMVMTALVIPGDVEVLPCGALEHPYHLPWCHKPLIRDRFLAQRRWTHFVYLEDDIRFGFGAFRHFLTARPLLAPHGLVPGFFRVEFSGAHGTVQALDQVERFDASALPGIQTHGLRFVAAPNPYCAMYVLDRALAEEHVADPAFDREESRRISPWEDRERAAMGLCWSRIPPGFTARQVIAVGVSNRMLSPGCLVTHLANNYADDPSMPFGKIALADVSSAGASASNS